MLRRCCRCWSVCSLTAQRAAEPSAPQYGMELQEATIALPDGVRLAADLYRPTGAAAGREVPGAARVPAVPQDRGARGRNWPLYSYFVQRGYVVARVDIRGTGNSEGTLVPYEYSDIELARRRSRSSRWLAQQPWSTGAVGMFGISWGGFNAIQMAGRHPPALKAFIAVDATDDLYQDDVHYMDGIMHLDSWEMSQDLDNARPGAPDYVIDEAYLPGPLRHAAVDADVEARTARRSVLGPRVVARPPADRSRCRVSTSAAGTTAIATSSRACSSTLAAPVKAMIGPWSHAWPHEPYPEARHGMAPRGRALVRSLAEGRRHRDHATSRRFAVYVRDWHPPGPYLDTAPGPLALGGRLADRAHRAAAAQPAQRSHAGRAPSRAEQRTGCATWPASASRPADP